MEGTYNFYSYSLPFYITHGFLCVNMVFSYIVNLYFLILNFLCISEGN